MNMTQIRDTSPPLAQRLVNSWIDALFRNWTSRTKLTRVVLVVLILMNFRTFEYFPGFRLLQDAWYGVCLVTFAVLYPLFKISVQWTFTRVELYLLGIIPVLFILPAVTASSVFGQPLLYGVLPQRSAVPILWWLLLINAWRLRWVSKADLEAALLFTCWGSFVLFNLMRLVLNPANFDQVVGFTVGYGAEASFTFSAYFAVFGLFYYVFQGIRTRRNVYYLLGAPQFFSALGHSGRSLAAAIILTLVIFLFKWRGFLASLPALAASAGLLALLLGALYVVDPAATTTRVEKFGDAFKVVSGASDVQDISANARVYETDTAKPYIAAHPLFGVGAVSLQWQGGLVAAVGEYFVPGDIGFVGIAFTYGVFGLFVFLAQYLFAFRFSRGFDENSSPLLDATRGFVLFSALYSTVTGLFVFNIEVSSFFIIVTALLNSTQREERPEPRSYEPERQAWSAVAATRGLNY